MNTTCAFEAEKKRAGYTCIAGVDEVGRGPWAGPVMAAAVVLKKDSLPEGIRDSKKLSAQKREKLAIIIHQIAHVGVGEASVAEIDEMNIREATFLAMKRALAHLPVQPDFLFVDGNALPEGLSIPAEAIIKGDDKVSSIACASIVAKVLRDNKMKKLHDEYPYYAWNTNAGYGTKAHQKGLVTAGVTKHHRQSFAPIRKLLEISCVS